MSHASQRALVTHEVGAASILRASEQNQARGLTHESEFAVVREDFKCCFHVVEYIEF